MTREQLVQQLDKIKASHIEIVADILDHDLAQREEIARLRQALEQIITYRNKVGALGFQLEKMDYFIGKAQAALAGKEEHDGES